DIVVVLLSLTVVPDHFDLGCDRRIVRGHSSAFAARAKILSRIEAECRSAPYRAGGLPAIPLAREILGTVRLASVFNYDQAKTLGKFADRVHVSHLAVKMYWDHGCYRATTTLADQAASGVFRALPFQILPKFLRIHVVGALVNVDKLRSRTRL